MPRLIGTDNVILTDDVIATETLRVLKNELTAARCVHRDHEKRLATKIGGTISIRKPFRVLSKEGRALENQPMVDEVTSLTINRHRHVGLNFTQNDRTLAIQQFSERYIRPSIIQIAHQVDLSIHTCAIQSGFFGSGAPGTAIDSDTFNFARAYMEKVGVPMDGNIHAFVDPLDRANIEADLKTVFNEKLVSAMVRDSLMGRLAAMNLWSTAQVRSHTVGVATGTPLIDGIDQTGNSLVTKNWTNDTTGILLKGDVFTIAGVYEINPQTYQSTGRLQRFVVTADVDSGATTGPATIPISPKLNDGTLTTVDGEGVSVSLAAYQNVTAAPEDNAAITVIGTGGVDYRQAPIWHRDAIALAVVDIDIPESAVVAKRVRDEDTGLSLLMTAGYDITNFKQAYRIDVIWGVKAVYPELIHRVWSDENT